MSSKPIFKLYRRKIFANLNCVRKLLFQILFILVLTCYLLLTEKISLPKWTKIRRKSAELGNQELKTLQSVHGTEFSQILNESPNENKNCSPFNHVGFLKIHKTGSTTVFNILARDAKLTEQFVINSVFEIAINIEKQKSLFNFIQDEDFEIRPNKPKMTLDVLCFGKKTKISRYDHFRQLMKL